MSAILPKHCPFLELKNDSTWCAKFTDLFDLHEEYAMLETVTFKMNVETIKGYTVVVKVAEIS